MEDKIFELISNMYSDIKGQFGKINERLTTIETKIASKADKTDIVTLEDKIVLKQKLYLMDINKYMRSS